MKKKEIETNLNTTKKYHSRAKLAATFSLGLLTACGTPSLEEIQKQKEKIEATQALLDNKIETRKTYINYIEKCDETENDPTASESRKKNAEKNEATYRIRVEQLDKEINKLKEKKAKADEELNKLQEQRIEDGANDDELPPSDRWDDSHS